MARTAKHIVELTRQIEQLETRAQALRKKLPAKVRFEMALKRTRAYYRGVSPKKIAEAAKTAVTAVRQDAARRG